MGTFEDEPRLTERYYGGITTADADVVLEGGGVKGTGLVGAITALTSAAE